MRKHGPSFGGQQVQTKAGPSHAAQELPRALPQGAVEASSVNQVENN